MKMEIVINEGKILESLLSEKAQLEIKQAEEMKEINLRIINARSRVSMLFAMAEKEL